MSVQSGYLKAKSVFTFSHVVTCIKTKCAAYPKEKWEECLVLTTLSIVWLCFLAYLLYTLWSVLYLTGESARWY